ncbi:MAG: arginyltransferase [Paraperlucidibaca sp.]
MSSGGNITFFTTAAHACSYLADRQAITLFADPEADMTAVIYSQLSDLGFRRSGNYVYRPQCQGCKACVSVRIPVAQFRPRREQRRCWQRNQDLTVTPVPVAWSEEHYALYARYISTRHRDGDMFPPSPRQYREFLTSEWSDTSLVEFRLDGQLLAIAVTDTLAEGLSAVYTFYDPEIRARSLGSFAILWQIEACRAKGLSSLYLGYWVRHAQRMRYKTQFRPLELLIENEWLLAR